jgi:hypothetical protein
LRAGALLGFAAPINRRMDQVPALGGPSLSVGFVLDRLGVWLDFDSLGNTEASHGTVLLAGSVMQTVNRQINVGARVGVGPTLVNFDDPAFKDVLGTTVRVEAVAEYAFNESWQLWLRPFTFDTLTARDLGGPIVTYEMRVGVGYRFGGHARKQPQPPQQQPYPYPPQQPYPYPPQQPQYPYPPPQAPQNPYPPPQQPYPPPGGSR